MKKALRKLFNKLGYDFVKMEKYGTLSARSKIFQVKVGNYAISIPGNNPLFKHYQYFPDYNIELGKLAQVISKKYPDSYLVDIGANVGDTIAVVKSVIDMPVIAIEGDEFSYKFLVENSVLFKNVHTINQFLGEKSEKATITTEKEGWNTTLIPSAAGEKMISLKTLDETLKENNFFSAEIKLIKIDAEGFDTIILRGATGTMMQHSPVLYFEYNRENMDLIGENGLLTLFSLTDAGYNKIAVFDNHGRCLIHTDLTQRDILQQLHNYADGIKGLIPHYDICIFHKSDNDLAEKFLLPGN